MEGVRLPVSYKGLAPHKITPMTGVHHPMHPSRRASRIEWPDHSGGWVIADVRVHRKCLAKE